MPPLRPLLASTAIYLAFTVVLARDVVARLATGILSDRADPILNAGILAWNATHVPWTDAWFNFPAFHPATNTLTFSEHLLGLSVLATPLYWLTGDVVIAYNVTALATFVLCGMAMFALVWHLTGSAAASFIAGFAYAFAPYRASQIAHVQALATFWAPLALLGLHGFVAAADRPLRRRGWWLALFAVAWAMQGAANGYLLVYFSLVIGLWVAWFVVARRRWRDLLWIAVAAIAAAAPLAPILWRFRQAHDYYGLTRPIEEMLRFSADISSIVCAPPGLAAWGWLSRGTCGPESEFFPGVALVLIVAIGALASRRGRWSVPTFYLTAAVVTWTLTWGPAPRWFGGRVLEEGPYAWLLVLPGLDALRVPARFWLMTSLCVSVVAGVVLGRALQARPRRVVVLVVAIAAGGLAVDAWTTFPSATLLARTPAPNLVRGGVALTLPLGERLDQDAAAQLDAIEGGWRSINGYSGYAPRHYAMLRDASERADPALLSAFASTSDLHVLVYERATPLLLMVEQYPGARLISQARGVRLFRIPRQPAAVETAASGTRLPIAGITASCSVGAAVFAADDDVRTRWECGPQRSGQELVLDLGTTTSLGEVVLRLGEYSNDYPRQVIIETSADALTWSEARRGTFTAETIAAFAVSPVDPRIVISLPRRDARYVRLRLTADDRVFFWSVGEIEVWSGAAPTAAASMQSR